MDGDRGQEASAPEGSGNGLSFSGQLTSPLAIGAFAIIAFLVVALIVVASRGDGDSAGNPNGNDAFEDHEAEYLSGLIHDPEVMSNLVMSGGCWSRTLVNNNNSDLVVQYNARVYAPDGLVTWERTSRVEAAARTRADIAVPQSVFGYNCTFEIVDVQLD